MDTKNKKRVTGEKAGHRSRAADHPAAGIWADRKDMADPSGYVRRIREGRFREPAGADGE